MTDELWLATSEYVYQFSPDGMLVESIPVPFWLAEPPLRPEGLAGNVYVGSNSGSGYTGSDGIDIMTPGMTVTFPPSVERPENAPTGFHAADVTLHGTVDPHNIDTNDCHFAYGTEPRSLTHTVPCAGGNIVSGNGAQQVSALLTGLTKGTTYYYGLVTGNSNGAVKSRTDFTVTPSDVPSVGGDQFGSNANADSFVAHAEINPQGAPTSMRVEYGPAPCSANPCTLSTGSGEAGSEVGVSANSLQVSGLVPGTAYYFRVIAENQSGIAYGDDRLVETFPIGTVDGTCTDAHVRQQV